MSNIEAINKNQIEVSREKLILAEIKENTEDPVVEGMVTFQTDTFPTKRKALTLSCRKSEAEAMIASYKKEIGEDFFEIDKHIYPKEIAYNKEQRFEIKDALKSEAGLNNERLRLLNKKLDNLFSAFTVYGRSEDRIKAFYVDNLKIYPTKYLDQVLNYTLYSKFPDLNEIEDKIKVLDGINSQFFYEINRW